VEPESWHKMHSSHSLRVTKHFTALNHETKKVVLESAISAAWKHCLQKENATYSVSLTAMQLYWNCKLSKFRLCSHKEQQKYLQWKSCLFLVWNY